MPRTTEAMVKRRSEIRAEGRESPVNATRAASSRMENADWKWCYEVSTSAQRPLNQRPCRRQFFQHQNKEPSSTDRVQRSSPKEHYQRGAKRVFTGRLTAASAQRNGFEIEDTEPSRQGGA